jgi:hypothetical protein
VVSISDPPIAQEFYSRYAGRPASPHPPSTLPSLWRQCARDEGTARVLGSGSLRADAYETIACAWLSLTTLLGLAFNALLGWWWADPAAALAIVPL